MRVLSGHAVVTVVMAAWLSSIGATLHAQPSAKAADPAVLQQRAQEGERALAEGRYADAEKAYESLRALSPTTAEVHARLGLIYFQQGKFSDAIAPLREAIKLKPSLPNIDVLLAMSLSELGHYDEALPALENGFKKTSDPVLKRMVGLHLMRAYTGLARDQDAVDAALALTRAYPDDPEMLYHTGRLFANFAYVQTMRLSRVAPDSVWMHQAAGEANESQGLYDAAIREYRQVLALAPKRPGIHFRIGRTLLSKPAEGAAIASAQAEALREFGEELQIDPTNANAAYEIGEIHRKAGQLAEARDYFARAVKAYPEFEDALVGLGRTLIALHEPAPGIPHLEAAVKINPSNRVAWYQLAQAHRALGHAAEQTKAVAEFTRLQKAASDRSAMLADTKRDVTKQELDTRPPPP
jgi:tetratricopeptide (TPR) repeat protein